MNRKAHDVWWRLAHQAQPRSMGESLLGDLLGAASVPFGMAVGLRNAAYDRGLLKARQAGCPVVSIGNVSVGGTGKSVCVAAVVRKLHRRFKRVGVLTRGYGSSGRYCLRWTDGKLDVSGLDAQLPAGIDPLADEPQMLARQLPETPVIVSADRVSAARWARERLGCEALVMDDGFQHRRLARDCDVVLINGRMPLGGQALLPRGPMREPMAAIRRAHGVILTRADEVLDKLGAWRERVRALNPLAFFAAAQYEPLDVLDAANGAAHPPQTLAGKRLTLVSSIGDPRSFDITVQGLHGRPLSHAAFPDHHAYTPADWQEILRRTTQDHAEGLLTTEKDWVRLSPLALAAPAPVPVWVLRIRLKFLSGEEALDDRLARL